MKQLDAFFHLSRRGTTLGREHSIVALGAGGVSKANLPGGRLERVANPKFPQQYLERPAQVLAGKEKLFRLMAGEES